MVEHLLSRQEFDSLRSTDKAFGNSSTLTKKEAVTLELKHTEFSLSSTQNLADSVVVALSPTPKTRSCKRAKVTVIY